jgi:hypothetical protein
MKMQQRPPPHNNSTPPRPKGGPPPVIAGWQPKREDFIPLPPKPEMPAPYDDTDIRAWQALNRGQATKEQQERCMTHLMFMVGLNTDPYVPGDPLATHYALGKRRVGVEINRIVATRPQNASDTEQGT